MRVTNAVPTRRRKRRILKRAKGFWGARHRLLKVVKETIVRADRFAFRDRRARKRDFRSLWITRLSAALEPHEMVYSRFINGAKKAGIALDRKQLSELAIHDPAAFGEIVAKAKAAL